MNLTLTGFNGATSARSWKSAGVLAPFPIALASMGPRARARGPIEARAMGKGARTPADFHERALVAPLKPVRVRFMQPSGFHFHERALVAPLKLAEHALPAVRVVYFHERALAAPLNGAE